MYDDLLHIWDGFWVLSPSRSVGFSVGAIPLAEMVSYCDAFGVDDREQFIAGIQAMDRIYVPHANAVLKANKDK